VSLSAFAFASVIPFSKWIEMDAGDLPGLAVLEPTRRDRMWGSDHGDRSKSRSSLLASIRSPANEAPIPKATAVAASLTAGIVDALGTLRVGYDSHPLISEAGRQYDR
jgi:hypothetical protein